MTSVKGALVLTALRQMRHALGNVCIYWSAFGFFSLLSFLYFPRRIQGLENIPRRGPFILASNHISNLDPFILGITSPQPLNFVAKEELFKNKVLARLFVGMGAFPIKRDTSDFRALRETLKRLKDGKPVLIFPEGTRRRGNEVSEPQPGIGFVVSKAHVPVVPVFISNSDNVLPPGARGLKRGSVSVIFGKPLVFQETNRDFEKIAEEIMSSVYALGKGEVNK